MALANKINKRWIYIERPQTEVNEQHYKLEQAPIPSPQLGEILVKAQFISVDPYMRIQQSTSNNWEEPHPLNRVQGGGVVGVVIESKDERFQKGDFVNVYSGWQLYATFSANRARKLDPSVAPVSTGIGLLGMPGCTAYFGLMEAGKPKAGETLVVSGAAGAVGSIVTQIGNILGMRVVGIAGSSEKCALLKEELGCHETINYKEHSTTKMMLEALKAAAPNGIDVYFDNTGGWITDAIVQHINVHARLVICGQITQYSGKLDEVELGPRFLHIIFFKRATIQGILFSDFSHRMGEMEAQVSQWLRQGKIQYKETFVEGFQMLPQALNMLFHGNNIGKLVVKIKDNDDEKE